MTTIGYATLQIIPSLDGVSEAVDKQLGGKLRIMGTQQGKQLSKGIGVGLKDLERDVESAGRAYQKLKDKASDSLGKVRTEEAALKRLRESGASDDRIVRVEERLATARRNSSRASREASDGHTVLLNSQKRLGDSSDDTGRKFGNLSTLAGSAGTALAGAGAIAGGAALAGIAALGAGVLVAGNRLYELGAQFDDLSDNLQIKTGLSGAALEGLKDSVEKLGTSNVPSTFAQIGNVAAEVTRNLHLTGPAFDEVTSRLANLQRMGVDVDVRTLGKAFRGFGVDAQSQAPALNSLYEASTKSGLSIDDLTAAVAKGGPALRQLGLDFGASAALVANFEAAGLDGEKGMTALTKATTFFAKENIPAKQGLQDTIAEIQRLGDTPEAADLANKVFGAKGGAAFYEAIRNGTLDLQSLRESLSSTGLDINQVSADTADWSEKWQLLKNNVGAALEPMATGLFDAVNAELGKAADGLLQHKDEIIGFFTSLGDIAITGAENFAHGIGGILQALGDMVGGIGNVKGVLDDLMGDFATLRGDDAAATAFHASAQEAYGWGESLRTAGDKLAGLNLDGLRTGLHNAGDAAKTSGDNVRIFGDALGALPTGKNITIDANTDPAQAKLDAFIGKAAQTTVQLDLPPNAPLIGPSVGRGAGGMIPGFSTRDDRLGLVGGRGLIGLAGGEGIVNAQSTRNLGGAPFINWLNGFASGGVVGPDVQAAKDLLGTAYSQGNRTDCSGMVARVINTALGMGGGLMSTKTAKEWLAERGFQPGVGGPGQITVGWYDHGPNPNDGHMAMTLSDGSHAEAGGSNSVFTVGAAASGADNPQFDQHMFLPTVYGEGPAGPSSTSSPFAGGSAVAAVTGGAPTTSDSSTTSTSSGGGDSISLPSSLSGFGSFGGEKLGDLLKGAGSLIDGQVASALDVFGVPDSPGWLKGISALIGGIKIGGGGSADPLSAGSNGTGTPPPDDPGNMHGGRAGQPPGPQVVINARDTEDAFVRYQRYQNEKNAAKLSRF